MDILVVEDDTNKARQIEAYLRALSTQSPAISALNVEFRRSYQSGLREAIFGKYDLILLDMTLPTYDVGPVDRGGRTRPYGGRDILSELDRRSVSLPVIVVTQFESFGEGPDRLTLAQLESQLQRDFPALYVGTVFYDASDSSWRERLKQLVVGLAGE